MGREIQIAGRTLSVDEEGYLVNFGEWDTEVAEGLATLSGITLTESHWEVLRFLRQYYAEFGIAPAIRVLARAMGIKLGAEKGNSKYLYELFPDSPAKQACKIAGLPRPTGCI